MATSLSTEITLKDAINVDGPPRGRTPRGVSPLRFKSPPGSLQSDTPMQLVERFPGSSFKLPPSGNSVDFGDRTNLIPWQKCFTELPSMGQLLNEVQMKNSDFPLQLEAVQAADTRSRSQSRSQSPGSESDAGDSRYWKLVAECREFVESFLSLLLQSKFIGFSGGIEPSSDPHEIIFTLISSKTCPEMELFRRVAVNPTLVASSLPENENPATFRRIPANHLARFCDIAVLRFLSSVSEHTDSQSVVWALDYLTNLLNSLISSLNSLSSYGWYGAPPVRIKKGTTVTRHSATCPPPGYAPPPVVVVGTPPPEENDTEPDPETGQHSPHASQDPEPGGLPQNASSMSLPAKTTSEQPSQRLQQHRGSTGSVGDGATKSGAPAARRRRDSRQENRAQLKPNLIFPEQVSHSSLSPPAQKSSSSSATSSSSLAPHVPAPLGHAPPARRPSPASGLAPFPRVSPPRAMGSIPEEESELMSNRMFRMGSLEREYFKRMKSDQDNSFEEDTDAAFPPHQERNQSPQLAPNPESLPNLSSIHEDEEEEAKPKPSSLPRPLQPEDIPDVDVGKELETLMNGEGRISLVAILHAIASLPGVPTVWTPDVGLRCFSVIQLCMNLGLAVGGEVDDKSADKEPVSAKSKRKLFQKGDNPAFKKIGAEKPSQAYSKLVVEHAINALIQCATTMIIGCTIDTGLCHLTYKHLPNQSRQVHNKLLRNLRRLHLHSPATFRQTMVKFASAVSCRKLFHFLHVVLQYCLQQGHQYFQVDSLLITITASVLRISVDKLVQLDINEPSIQNVSE